MLSGAGSSVGTTYSRSLASIRGFIGPKAGKKTGAPGKRAPITKDSDAVRVDAQAGHCGEPGVSHSHRFDSERRAGRGFEIAVSNRG
jgi:hypothetical protein